MFAIFLCLCKQYSVATKANRTISVKYKGKSVNDIWFGCMCICFWAAHIPAKQMVFHRGFIGFYSVFYVLHHQPKKTFFFLFFFCLRRLILKSAVTGTLKYMYILFIAQILLMKMLKRENFIRFTSSRNSRLGICLLNPKLNENKFEN